MRPQLVSLSTATSMLRCAAGKSPATMPRPGSNFRPDEVSDLVRIGYHASHEQFSPSELLRFVQMAEQVGFHEAKSSDHFHPWSERQGQSGHAWSWLGAALQATRFPIGVISVPGYRYHPAVLA